MRTVSLLGILALGVAACGGGDADDPDAGYNCDNDPRDEAFVAGLEKVGAGGTTFRLVSSDPAPPARGDNAWVLEVETGGAPMAGATVDVTPFMPDHQHGSPVAVEVTPTGTDGRYDAAPLNFWMPGLWEITVEAAPAGGGATDDVVFRFCIPA
ncbi:MAG: FixH family protein [Kofleriaceae bacterium]